MFETGYRGVNKQGLEYEILDGTRSKATVIKFIIDDTVVTTTKNYLKNGLPCHPTYGKYKVGEKFLNNKGYEFELVEKVSNYAWKIRFTKDGVECVRDTKAIKTGNIKHPTDGIPVVGDRYEVKSGWITVIEIKNATDVTVRFDDGSIQKTTFSDIRKRVVGHPTSGLYIGQKFKTNSGWEGEVIDYKSCYEVGVRWQDGSIEYHPAGHIKNGGIKPLYQPSVAGVGYFGEGRFVNGLKKNGEKAPDEVYAYWQRMLVRCFNPEEILKSGGRWYIFVNVHKDWFCFQNFAEWALKQPNWNRGFELDKDLIGDGLEYGPEKCTFLPADVNIFLAENCTKVSHDLPAGVQYIRPATLGAKVGYVARCHTDKGREYLGYFDDPMEAHLAYKVKKEEYAKILAEKYKDVITPLAYEKLLNFKVKLHHTKPHRCGELD